MNFQPLTIWPKPFTKNRQRSSFSAGFQSTLDLLDKELLAIKASNVVLQLAIDRGELRRDGKLRASARPAHPGVILSFEKPGPNKKTLFVSMPCDTFLDWKENLRAIALSLEALRKVDRYGVAQTGEQYRGWEALPPGADAEASEDFRSREEAGVWLSHIAKETDRDVLSDPIAAKRAYQSAAKFLHPDVGGNPADFRRLQNAKVLLGVR